MYNDTRQCVTHRLWQEVEALARQPSILTALMPSWNIYIKIKYSEQEFTCWPAPTSLPNMYVIPEAPSHWPDMLMSENVSKVDSQSLWNNRESLSFFEFYKQVTVQAFPRRLCFVSILKVKVNRQQTCSLEKKEREAISYTRPPLSLKDEFTPKWTCTILELHSKAAFSWKTEVDGGVFNVPGKPRDPKLTSKDLTQKCRHVPRLEVSAEDRQYLHDRLTVDRVNIVFSNEFRMFWRLGLHWCCPHLLQLFRRML